LDRAESLSPTDVEVLTLLGKIKGRLGQFPEAVTLFQRVIQLSPNSAEAHVNLAIAFYDAGALPKALEETSRALVIDPNLEIAHLNRGRILDDLRREPEAAAEFAAARRLTPNDPDVYYYWSFVERAEGHFVKESDLLQQAVKLEPQNEKAFILLANSLLDQSRKPEAVVVLRDALAVNPKSTEATYMLSRALLKSDPAESKRLQKQFEALRAHSAALDRSKKLANQGYGAYLEQDWTKG
jgi:tetratricopeptide (TPR) repeat protein